MRNLLPGNSVAARGNKIFLFLIFALSLSAFLLPVVNPDIFWHLLAGKYMFIFKKIPAADFMTWTMRGERWLDFEWLVQILYFAVWSGSGFYGLYALKFAVLAFAFWVMYSAASAAGAPKKFLLFVLPLSAAALVPSSDLRPENFSLLFFALLLKKLEDIREGRTPAGAKRALFFLILFAAWANIHAGFAYGLALILIYFAGEFFQGVLPFIYGRSRRFSARPAKKYLLFFSAAFAAVFVNPWGWKIFRVMENHREYLQLLQEHIQEWKMFDISGTHQLPFAVLFFITFIMVLARFVRNKDVPYAHIFALLFFAYFAINHSRLAPFFVIAAVVYSSRLAGLSNFGGSGRTRFIPLLVLLLLLAHYAANVWDKIGGVKNPLNSSPPAVEFLKRNSGELKNLRMYNQWGWGGYLSFHLWPDYRTFIDGRYIFHPFLEEVEGCSKTYENWRNFTDKYGIELLVLERDDSKIAVKHDFGKGRSVVMYRPSYLAYNPKKDWALVHWDGRLVILVKREAVAPGWLEKHEYRLLRADDIKNVAFKVLNGETGLGEIEAEVKRYLRQNPPTLEGSLHRRMEKWYGELNALSNK